jgi:glucosamine--fructose-6-phosphate aminotransferase (isomerizing)
MSDDLTPGRGGYPHYMLKEICENPQAVRATVAPRISSSADRILLDELPLSAAELRAISHIYIAASGTSRHAGMAGKIMLQELAEVPVELDYASEFQYRSPMVGPHDLAIFITQSGETADTIGALHAVAARKAKTLAICNVVGASIAQLADAVLYTHAGPEIAIASTKAFTAQLAALFLFAIYLGQLRGTLTAEAVRRHLQQLLAIPDKLETVLQRRSLCEGLAEQYVTASDFLFVGRGIHLAAALDGALKLKEVSYIHAEGYPAGEMKHGPYALIDAAMPCVFLAAKDPWDSSSLTRHAMTIQDMRNVQSKLGRVIAVGVDGDDEIASITKDFVAVPPAPELLLPLLEIVPLQLLAYHIGVRRGLNVDNPRNLVKAVTKE